MRRLLLVLIVLWAIAAAATVYLGVRGGTLATATIAGLSLDAIAAVLVLIAAIVIAVRVATARRVPLLLRAFVVLLDVYMAVPIVISLAHGKGLSDSLGGGATGLIPFFLRGAYLGVEAFLPAAALVALAAAIGAFVRRRGGTGARHLATALALALCAQIGAYQAGVQSLPTIVAFEHPPATAAAGAGTIAGAFGGSPSTTSQSAAPNTTSQSAAPSIAANAGDGPPGPATQPCFTPDTGPGNAAKSAVAGAAGLFNSNATPPPAGPDAACQSVRDYITRARAVLGALPQREIALIPLAQSVPNDAAGIDTFVRDSVGLNVYPGVLRGPLGTWLARAGSPTDKLTLLAQLLKMHGVGYTFVRGTLSEGEITEISSAVTAQPSPAPQTTDDPGLLAAAGVTQSQAATFRSTAIANAKTYEDQMLPAMQRRADALIAELKSSNVATSAADPSAAWPATLRTHFWLRLNNGTDLDPTLARLAPGTHLGTTAAETTDSPPSPAETAQVIVRVIVTTRNGATTSDSTVLEAKHNAYEFADSAGMLVMAPPNNVSPDETTTVTTVTPAFTLGSDTTTGTPITAGPSLAGARLEIERDLPGQKPEIFVRSIAGGESDPNATGTHLLRAYHIVVATQPLNRTYGAARLLNALIGARAYLAWSADPASNLRGQDFTQQAPSDYPIDVVNYLERVDATDAAIGAADHVQFVYDRPQIVMEVNEFERVGSKNVPNVLFDIVDNGMATTGSDRAAAFRANVTRGVAATYIEGQAIAAVNREDTPTLLHAAESQNVPTVVLDGSQKRRPDVTLPAAIGNNLDQTFAHGAVAVAPQKMIAIAGFGEDYGWWAVDPSGNTVGRMGSGAGQDLPEWAAITNWILNGYNVAWALLVCHGGGSKADCQGAWCSAVFGAVLGLFTSFAGGVAVGAGAVSSGTADVVGLGLGGLPGPGWSPGGAACSAAGIGS
jgi:hypothetical protein